MNFQTSCCRICLKSELLMSFYLYSPTFPLRPIEIIEKLNIFKYDETLPALLCQSCLYRLLDAYNLQQLAEASERRLRDYIANTATGSATNGLGLCNMNINSINHDSSSFSSTTAVGDTCKEAEMTSAIYANICDMFERSNEPPNNEMTNEKACIVGAEDMLNDIEIDVSSLTRSEANEDTLNDVFNEKHVNTNLNRGITIEDSINSPKLSFSPTAKYGIDEIITEVDKDCGTPSKNPNCLEVFKLAVSNEKIFQCKQCPRQFKQSSNLLIHQRTHTGERRFQCEICASFFTTSSNLKAHRATHLEQREHRCCQCDRDFKTLRELRRHEPIHKTVKDNVCGKCQKAFTKRCYLLDHIAAMHHGIRRHKCAECGKLFGRRSNLVSHLRIHSGEKPFQCKLCEWKFNQSSALARHMKKHTKSENLNFDFKATDQVLKNILHTPEVNEVGPVEIGEMHIAPQSSFNVLNNITSFSDETESLQNTGGYDFTKDSILNFSTNQQVL